MGRPTGSKNKAVEAYKTNEILSSVSGLTLDNVSNKLAAVQVEVQHTLAGLSTKLTEQLAVLGNVENAIVLKKGELKDLYGIEATATTMDELTAQIEEQKLQWAKDQAAVQQQTIEDNSNRVKQWTRDEEQYNYKRDQERRQKEDAFTAKLALLEKDNRLKQENLEKMWTIREADLKAREQELNDLRTQVASFPAQLKAETEKVGHIVKANTVNEYETRIKIATAEAATDKKLQAQEITSLNKALAEQQQQMNALRTQLNQAHEDIKTISQKALESAASRETVANLQRAFESVQTGKGSK